jgi:hypothetical protein
MAGIPDHNFPEFNRMAFILRSFGHFVYNPAEIEPEEYAKISDEEKRAAFHNSGYRNCLSRELKWICDEADAMFLLKGWEHSKGANSEFATGKAVGVKFFYQANVLELSNVA